MIGDHRGRNFLIGILYLAFGLYLLNDTINIIALPVVSKWVIFAAGIFLIFGSFKFFQNNY